jgi:hypothetical protein
MEQSSNVTIERETIISATKKTFRFGKNVYQTHNITGFREGDLDGKIRIPEIIIFFIFLIGLIFLSYSFINDPKPTRTIGISLILLGFFGHFINLLNPKKYGLLVTFNSGDRTLFITKDRKSLKTVIDNLCKIIESEEEEKLNYQISINNSVVRGNLVQGEVGKDVSFNSNDDSQDID